MKISILLPYKENFSPEYPGAVSLFVYETSKISRFKKNITVFGYTKSLDNIIDKKSYVNLEIPSVKFSSRTNIYVNKFIRYAKTNKPSLIEIHNRPSYLLEIYKRFQLVEYLV